MRQIPAKEEETNVLESILSGLEEGVVVTDGQWKITHINQTAKELLNIHETDTANIDLQTHLSRLNLSIPVDTLMTTREKTTDFQILPANTKLLYPSTPEWQSYLMTMEPWLVFP